MRAVIHHEFGEPADVLGVEEVDTPTPGPGEVRLRVLLSPIHNHDLWTVRGTYGYKPSYGWGNPGYPNIGAEFDKYVTREHGSSFRAIEGFSQYSEVVNLIDRLQARGYSEEDVRKILGENYMRIFAQVWR